MFELNGKQYSVDDLQKAAVKYGMDYNAYLEKMTAKGLKEVKQAKTEDVVKETADAASENQAVDTDSASEDGSSVLQELNQFKPVELEKPSNHVEISKEDQARIDDYVEPIKIEDFDSKSPSQIKEAYKTQYGKYNEGGFSFKSHKNHVEVFGPDGESITVRTTKRPEDDSFFSGFGQTNMLSGALPDKDVLQAEELNLGAEEKINEFINSYRLRDKKNNNTFFRDLGKKNIEQVEQVASNVKRSIGRLAYDYIEENEIDIDKTRELTTLSSDPEFIDYVTKNIKEKYYAFRQSDYSQFKPTEEGGYPELNVDVINSTVQDIVGELASQESVNAKMEANKNSIKNKVSPEEYKLVTNGWKSAHIASIYKPEEKKLAQGMEKMREISSRIKNVKNVEDAAKLNKEKQDLLIANKNLLKNVMSGDQTFLYSNGKRVNPILASEQEEVEDVSKQYAIKKASLAASMKSEPETVSRNYYLHLEEYNDFYKKSSEKYNIYEGDYSMVDLKDLGRQVLNDKMTSLGYKRNDKGVYRDVSLNDLMNITSGRGASDYAGKIRLEDGSKGYREFDFDTFVANSKQTRRRLNLEHEAWKNLYLLNIDPGSIKFDSFGDVAAEFTQSLLSSIPGIGKETAEKTFTTERNVKNNINKIIDNINVAQEEDETPFLLSEEQKEAFEVGFGEELTAGVGSFIPMIAEIAIASQVTGGVGAIFNYEKYLKGLRTVTYLAKSGRNSKTALDVAVVSARAKKAKMTVDAYAKSKNLVKATGNTYNQAMALALKGLEEEGKMALLDPMFGVDMPLGAGAGFTLGGALFGKFSKNGKGLFKGQYGAALNPIIQRNVVGGIGGMVGAQTAAPVEAIVDHLRGNKTFNAFVDEKYGDMEQWAKHALMETLQFGIIGFHNYNKADLALTTGRKRNLLEKSVQKYEEALKEGKESEVAKWGELSSQLTQQLKVLDAEMSFEDKTLLAKNTSDTLTKINKEYKQESGEDAFNFEVVASDNNRLGGDIATVVYEKGKPKVIINVNKMKKGTLPHEVYHIMSKLEFDGDIGIQKALQAKLASHVKGLKLKFKDGGDKGLQERVDDVYVNEAKETLPEEFNANLLDILATKENQETIIAENIFEAIQQDIYGFFEKRFSGTKLEGLLPKLESPEAVIKFLSRYGKSMNKGEHVKAMNTRFKNIQFAGKKLVDQANGRVINAESLKAKDLEKNKERIYELEAKLNDIYEDYQNGEIDQDSFEQQEKNIEFKIETLKNAEAPVVKKITKETKKKSEESSSSKKSYNNEELISTVKSEKSTLKEKTLAETELVYSFDTMALNAIKYDTRKGDYNREDVRDYLRTFFPKIVDTYNPETSKFSTWVYNNIAPKAQQTYEKFKKAADKSLDTEAGAAGAVKEVSGDANSTLYNGSADSGKPAGKLIDVTEFPRVKDKEAEIREGIDIEGLNIENLTYKNVQDLFAGEVGAKILGVHEGSSNKGLIKNLAERIMGTRTLNYGKKGNAGEVEVRAMQSLFINYSEVVKFIKTMPEFNVAPRETTVDKQGKSIDLTEDAKGYSIGVSNKILKQFYEPYIDPKSKSSDPKTKAEAITSPSGRGKAKTSQVATVYRLKPEYRGSISKPTVEDLQQKIGITPRGVSYIPIVGKKRSEFGTALQGLTKMYASNVANTIVRKKIVEQGVKVETKTIDEALADIGGGKAPRMFSKDLTTTKEYDKGQEEFSKKVSEEVKKILKVTGSGLPDHINEQIQNIIANKNFESKEVFQAIFETATQDLSLKAKRNFGVKLVSDLIKAKGKDFGSVLAKNLKDVRKIFEYEYETIGFEMETSDLKEKLENVKDPVDKDELVKDWLLSVSRSARSSGGKNLLYVSTNKKIVENVLQDLLGKESKFTVGESVKDGRTVTFVKYDGKGLEGFLDITELKTKGIKKHDVRVRREADKARKLALDRLDRLKDRLDKKEITKGQFDIMLDSYLSLIKLDQRGLIRKMSKPKSEIEAGKYKPTSLYLEHKMSAEEIRDLLYSYGQGEVKTREQVLEILEREAFVNIMPKSLEKKLPNFKKERTKNSEYKNADGYKTKEYLEAVQKYKDEIFDADGNPSMFSKDLNVEFNDIIENKTGIASYKKYGDVKAKIVGQNKGKYKFFISSSAEDFVGLLYNTLGKGKKGDAQMAWYKKNLLDPYAIAMDKVSKDRVLTSEAFRTIKKELGIVPKDLKKKIKGEDFNQEQAIRVYIWDKQGYEIPGISKNDKIFLSSYIQNNTKLKGFADQIMAINKGQEYLKPSEDWVTGTITTDVQGALNTTRRIEYLKQWQENVDVIFSKENLNKLEAAYGVKYRKAMENILGRMKSGRNRSFSGDIRVERFVDWWKSATGVTMFFNTRSAALQTLSSVNFIDFKDNNIFAASKAFANQPQYWKDFKMLFNSDFLSSRRDGLKMNVNEADIADLAKERGARGVMNRILKFGFTPTQMADSFAIAAGGSTYYRNKYNRYTKEVNAEGEKVYTEKQAHEKAMMDFREAAETTQQSSRPDKISQQQASALGSTILAFANTPAQYAREIKKAARDLKNGRGDLRTNVSKIIYYGVAQNLLFTALQQALFAMDFEDDEEVNKKTVKVINGMSDSILRGLGVYGAATSVLKNTALKLYNETKKKNPDYSSNIAIELTGIVPPVSSKLKKIASAGRVVDWKIDEIKEKGFSLDNPALLPAAKYISAGTNLPLDRVYTKVNNILTATEENLETWQRIALISGWQDWDIGAKKDSKKNKRNSTSIKRKIKSSGIKRMKIK